MSHKAAQFERHVSKAAKALARAAAAAYDAIEIEVLDYDERELDELRENTRRASQQFAS